MTSQADFDPSLNDDIKPFIPANQSLPEITLKGTILSLILAAVLGGANTYLGLKVGMTVAASIPAAIISMALLRFFKNHNILENNIVQTAASAGEALAAGALFTLPALIIVRYWTGFDYWSSVAIMLTGGLLGVLFSIPLRRILIHDNSLKFPEGVAIGNVLKLSTQAGANVRQMVYGAGVGGLFTLSQNGFKLLSDGVSYWTSSFGTVVGLGLGFDAAVIGAGFIVGVQIALSLLVGAVFGWCVGIPILGFLYEVPVGVTGEDAAMFLWSNYLRYVGVGTMLVGGTWAIVSLAQPMITGIKASLEALHIRRTGGANAIPRTERDIPINQVFWGILVCSVGVLFIFDYFLSNEVLNLSTSLKWSLSIFNVIYLLIAGFIFSAICGYLAGLVGASSSPISGMVLSAILISSLLLLPLLAIDVNFIDAPDKVNAAVAIAIVVSVLCSTAASIANDNLQDLKAGQIVGATPWKQQAMLMFGVVVSAFIIPPIMDLLYNAYGIGGVYPREGMDPNLMLAAPQAGLMASIATGVFGNNLPWGPILVGAVLAVICIIVDSAIKPKGYRLPVLAVGIGIYLPLGASIPLIIGGILSFFVHRGLDKSKSQAGFNFEERKEHALQKGTTIACGLVAGASIMGIFLAIPAVIYKSGDVLRLVPPSFEPMADILIFVAVAALFMWIYRTVIKEMHA